MGANLSPVDVAQFTAKRKKAYEALHPETKPTSKGGGGRNNATRRQVGDDIADRFTSNTSAVTGEGERTVQRNAERGEQILERVLGQVRGTCLDTGVYLDKLKKLSGSKQEAQVKADLKTKAAKSKPTSNSTKPNTDVKARAAKEVAEIIAEYVPGDLWDGIKANLYSSGAKNVATELTNVTDSQRVAAVLERSLKGKS